MTLKFEVYIFFKTSPTFSVYYFPPSCQIKCGAADFIARAESKK